MSTKDSSSPLKDSMSTKDSSSPLKDSMSTKDSHRSSIDRTKDKDKFAHILKGWIDKFAVSMNSSDTKNYIQQLVIEPFLQYIFDRSFPYVIIAVCVFAAMLIIIILIFVLLLLTQNKTMMCAGCLRTAP